MFVPDYPTEHLKPAPYNPRAIAPDALDNLKASIGRIGFVKPIIVDTRHVIAGHQRTKAARALGRTTVPAFVINRPVVEVDEVRFNQLHNGTDIDVCDVTVRVPPGPEGFADVPAAQVDAPLKAGGATVRRQIADLVVKYGPWGGAVATLDGLVISSQQYAIACKVLGVPVRVYRLPHDKAAEASTWFQKQYGAYSYAHLPKETFIQALAQPKRLRQTKDTDNVLGNNGQSFCYTKLLEPRLFPGARVLDFGCGHGDYALRFQQKGHRILPLEFFRQLGGRPQIDTAAVHRMVDRVLEDFATHGPFDFVICEAVINSVDTLEAEASVLGCMNLFAKMGGTIIWAGRALNDEVGGVGRLDSSEATSDRLRREIEFLDEHGFSGIYRVPFGATGGRWFYQKFHSRAQAEQLTRDYGFDQDARFWWAKSFGNWRGLGVKCRELPRAQCEAALRFEFNLPWPSGTVNRHEDAVAAYRKAYPHAE